MEAWKGKDRIHKLDSHTCMTWMSYKRATCATDKQTGNFTWDSKVIGRALSHCRHSLVFVNKSHG